MAQYIYALDENKNPIDVESAKLGSKYICPDCNNFVFPKNQGKIKEHHFVHFSGSSHKGAGESENHSNTTLFLLDFFRGCLESREKIVKKTRCESIRFNKIYDKILYGIENFNGLILKIRPFNSTFFYNVLEGVNRVEREFSVKDSDGTLFRPDLALLDGDKLVKAVEVVYTHEDSEEKTKFYQNNKIDVIKIDIKNFDDFYTFKNKWDYFNNLKTVIYVNKGCPIRTTPEMLISNLETRQLIKYLWDVFDDVDTFRDELSKLSLEAKRLYVDSEKLSDEIEFSLIDQRQRYSDIITFAQVTASTLKSELKTYTLKQKEIQQEDLIKNLNHLFDELNEIKQQIDPIQKELHNLSLEYGVHLHILKENIAWYKGFLFKQKINDLKKAPDFEITNKIITLVKKDIVSFKNNSKYRNTNWISSKEDRENFIIDYMVDRRFSCGFEFYNQLMYVCMCRNWNLDPIASTLNA